ncbi:MAG: hypothetical protein AMXMBFR53_12050 [Gemmatimonadota bacterium]
MSDAPWCGPGPSRRGFTLIEVIGALVIFSLGVIMVLQLSGALSRQMLWSGQTSTIVARAQERVDSLEATPFDSLSLGTFSDTVSVLGTAYLRRATITKVTAILYQIDVSMAPAGGGEGPTYATTSYAASAW